MLKRKQKVSPGVVEWQHTQEQMGQAALRVAFRPHPAAAAETADVPVSVLVNDPVSDPVNDPVNDRQPWFPEQLGRENPVKARDVAES